MPKLAKYLGSVAVILTMGGAVQAEEVKADTVVATVNGTEITLGHMASVRESLPAQYQQLPDDVLFEGILEQLIQQTALAEIGQDMMTHRDEIALEVDRRAYLANSVLESTAGGAVTDDALKAAYDAKYANAEPTREYHAAHIIVETEEEAANIKKEIEDGLDFGEAAKKYSTDGAAPNGGDLGWFGLEAMVKPFSDALAEMKDGEVKGPVQTEFGWHVVKLMETRLAEAPTMEEVRAELEGDLRQAAVEKRVTETVETAKVEKMTEGVDPAILKDAAILGE